MTTYTLILLAYVNGLLIPHVFMTDPWTEQGCRDRKVALLSGATERVQFKAWCVPTSK